MLWLKLLMKLKVIDPIEKIIGIYIEHAKRYSIGRLIDDMGLDNFKKGTFLL